MKIATPFTSNHPTFKMEDRKRAAGDDLAPPMKRKAFSGKNSAHDSDMPWASELELYQKDAIYRQMLEYKREKATLETHVKDIRKRSLDHDDHLRIVDAWWIQLLDEIKLLAEDEIPSNEDIDCSFPTSLTFKGAEEFQNHLASKAKLIKNKLSTIFTNLNSARGQPSNDVHKLQSQLTDLLARQKESLVKIDRLRVEKEELTQRLEESSLRYVKAEKRLDRAKSAAVAKLEQQAIAASGSQITNGKTAKEGSEISNGSQDLSDNSRIAYEESVATVAKQKEQLQNILAENKSLTEQLTAANTKLCSLTEEDFARTDLFKQIRIQHDDIIRRINHLEATNIQLREEAERFQAERTAYRLQIENEAEILTGELENQLQRVEQDLVRIRSTRDELSADLSIRKMSQEQERASTEHLKELVCAKENRIVSLEHENERLRVKIEEQTSNLSSKSDTASLSFDELRRNYESLEQQFNAINKELPALQAAWRKTSSLASKKVFDLKILEERVRVLSAEKAKADQKYFAARKDMDTRIQEVRTLKAQNFKSSEIISQLKEIEKSNRILLSNLEKQLSDTRQANTSIMLENKKMEGVSRDMTSKVETLKAQIAELNGMLKSKDMINSNNKERFLTVEQEMEKLRVKYESAQKEKDQWRMKSLQNQSGDEEMLRVRKPLSKSGRADPSSHSLSVQSAGKISKIPQLKSAVTPFVIIALPIDLRIECENALIVQVHSLQMM
ncbi:E3 ubiquitin-protein ligase BRE1 [Golovinomyces cichoracearum]|uniref:E3 ubiquitin protein ligase n=1 Tax=Golovinomyces cichoracearum TaxID=62708 RepID=A0A420J5P8_9PEZI|nr:E3 ubiquitin-protein ligase BRE1 [Golovinomyces cichoracearum]